MKNFHFKLIVFIIILLADDCSATCADRGWTEYRSFCYRVFRSRSNYLGAQDTCVRSRANLTSVHSRAELVFLTAISAGQADNNFWIGLLSVSGAYTWVDGTEMTPWASRNIASRSRDCGAVAGETMVTRPCHFFYYFICKKPAEIASTTRPSTYTTTTTTTTSVPTSTSSTTTATTTTTHTTTTTTTTRTTTTTTSTTTTPPALDIALTTTTTFQLPSTTVVPSATTSIRATTSLSTSSTFKDQTTTMRRDSMTDIVQDLIWVKKKSDTASVPDNRPSAVGIGAFGVFIMAAIFVLVFLMDIGTFVRHFRWMRSNIKYFCRNANRHGLCEIDKNRI